uniref:Reverse transcriptase domain-containing protein n=1 Tax=Cannabis sativa TaxID=3483 RepID=A0A803PL05_CANSA
MGIWRDYLRIRVTVNIDLPLKRRIKLKKTNGDWLWCQFEYEFVPTFCFICGIIGHSESFCHKLFETPIDQIKKPYGLWMKAEPRRKKQRIGAQWLRTGTDSDKQFSDEFESSGRNDEVINGGNQSPRNQRGTANTYQGQEGGQIHAMNDGENHAFVNSKDASQSLSGRSEERVPANTIMVIDTKRRRTIMEGNEGTNEEESDMSLDSDGLSKNGSLDLVIHKRPKYVFLCETLCKHDSIERLKVSLGFEGLLTVDAVGRSGGLALLWKVRDEIQVLEYSSHHIDVSVHAGDKPTWRLTGCYGEPNRNNRVQTWTLLRNLSVKYDLPWCVIGDLNNVTSQEDKKGGNAYPDWLINGFNQALSDCHLNEFALTGYQYTWEKGRGTNNWIEVRLDRALVNQRWMNLFNSAKLLNLEWSISDHCPLLLVPWNDDFIAAHKTFRFEKRLAKGTNLHSNCQRHLGFLIRTLKNDVRKWRKGRDADSIEKFKEAEKQLFEVYTQREVFWRQRSKQLWLREGDHNSKYFHAYATSRKKHNAVSKLRDTHGNWIDWNNGLADVIVNYFNDLFCTSNTFTAHVIAHVPTTVSEAQNASLLAPVSNEEVRKVLFQMHPDKSPCPDGMTPGFFQRCWSIVGLDIINLVRSFMTTGILPQGLNDTNMVLIPKVKNPTSMIDLRPISLCNVLYKIISKVLANRLKEVLPQLISTNQSAFVPGRLITDNIMISYEVMHYLKRKSRGKEGFMAISLDFSKAYDRVEWQFLRDIMSKMGFSHQWINLILSCVSSVRYKVLNSGREMGPIIPSRGIRQGDPLSSYLFLICAEGFSALINQFESSGHIRGCKVANGAPTISHMLFADDSYLYCRANEREATNVIRLLKIFEEASGQVVNFNKSSIFYSNNTTQNTRDHICHLMQIQAADGTSMYLGLPSLVGKNKKAILGFIKDKLQKRVQHWEGRFLSKAGKEILLKTVAQAFPSYAMSVFLLPLETCKSLEGIMSSFWWKSSKDKQGVSWHSWKKLCKHKTVGGLGFRDFREYNLALLGKQAWRLLTEEDSLVCKFYKARYFSNGSFLNASLGHNPSFIWKSIYESKDLIVAGARVRIGNGLNTYISNSPWLPDMNQPYITSSHPAIGDNKVASLMQVDHLRWDEDVVHDLFNDRDRVLILGIPLPNTNLNDRWSWKFESSGYYSVKSAYRHLTQAEHDTSQAGDFWKNYWKIKAPPKVLHFGWRAISGSLPTRTQLQTKHVYVSNSCPVCNIAEESIIHILVLCSFANSCWNRSAIDITPTTTATFRDWYDSVTRSSTSSLSADVLMIAWQIWSVRNDVLWNGKVKTAANIVLEAKSYLNQWLYAQKNRFEPILVQSNQGLDVEHWTKPGVNSIKVNVDGAIFATINSFGIGFIVRDCNEQIIEAGSKCNIGNVAPELAEICGIKEVLSWIKNKAWHDVILETDSLLAVQGINSSSQMPSAFGMVAWDCKNLLSDLGSISLKSVKHSANKVVHFLAGSACFSPVRIFHNNNSPEELLSIVMVDSI